MSVFRRVPSAQAWRVTLPEGGIAGIGLREGRCAMATRSLRWCIGLDVHTLRMQLRMRGYVVQTVERKGS